MATSNFYSMSNFPLWAISDSEFYSKRCPECYCSFETDAETCSECNTDLTDVDPDFDEFAADEYRYNILKSIEQENENVEIQENLSKENFLAFYLFFYYNNILNIYKITI